MLRQASSRNQRARGFRFKHVIKMGILITACIWLIYQVKHSHEKKRAYGAKSSKFRSKAIEKQEDFFKFGWKDLTRSEEAATVAEIHKEDESEEVQEEEEDPEMKQELEMDQIDEQDQPDADEESDHGIDSAEEEDKGGQMEEADIFDSQDQEGGTLAREENYKRDDVSSAVVHTANATESEIVTGYARSMDEERIVDGSKVVNKTFDGSKGENGTTDGSVNNLSDFAKENNNMPNADLANNGTAAESKESETRVSNSDNALVSNSTIARENIETDLLTNSTQWMNAADELNNQINPSANSTASVSENQTDGKNNATAVEPPAEVRRSNYPVATDSAHLNTTAGNALNRAEMSNSTVPFSLEHSTTSSSTHGNGDAGTVKTDDLSRAVRKVELSNLADIQKDAAIIDEDARVM